MRAEKDQTCSQTIRKRRYSTEIKEGYIRLLWRVVLIVAVGWLLFTQVFLIGQAPELYTFHALTADRLVAVFPEAHPSASKKSVSLSELKKESFILMPPHTSIYRFCMQSFHNAGIHPQLLRTARAESIVSAVEIGEGISLLTESSFQFFRQPSLVAIPVNGLEKLSVGIAHKKNMALTTSAECFLQFVKSHM